MRSRRINYVHKLTIGGLLLAIGIIIPRIFHMFGTSNMGRIFLPMHLSIFIAGIYLGIYYGMIIGFLTPLLNSLFGMPVFPQNLIMAFELAAYGLFAGLFMYLLNQIKVKWMGRAVRVYISLILSMISGRIVNALVLFVMARFFGMKVPAPFSVVASALTGLPGIIIQILLVPGIVIVLFKARDRHFR